MAKKALPQIVRTAIADMGSLVSAAARLQIETAEDYEQAAILLRAIKTGQKRLAEKKAPLEGTLKRALEEFRALFRTPEESAAQAENALKFKMNLWDKQQKAARIESQRIAECGACLEKNRLLDEASEAESAGDHARAAEIREDAERIVPPITQDETPKLAGIAYRETWSAEVVDKHALVAAIAGGLAPLASVEPNMKFLNQQARSLRAELNYPGVRARRERSIAANAND